MSDLLSVLSLGRSGSTFLQRLLNTHPSIALLGEHAGFVTDLASACRKLTDPRTAALIETGRRYLPSIFKGEPITSTPGGWSSEWTNAFTATDVTARFASLIKDLIYPPHVRCRSHAYWGFKEIRYGSEEVAFLASLFPTSRFILLLRNPIDVYHSQCRLHWSRHLGPARAAHDFHRQFRRLRRTWELLVAGDLAPRAQLICYERLGEDPGGELQRITSWLGVRPLQTRDVQSVADAQLTPHLAQDTPEVNEFLRAYTSRYGDADLACYDTMISGDARPASCTHGHAPSRSSLRLQAEPVMTAAVVASSHPHLREQLAAARHTGKRILFFHIPGTCGARLHDEIVANFEPGEVLVCRTALPPVFDAERLRRYRFISGHFDLAEIDRLPGETYVFTVLRDPVQRLRFLCGLPIERAGTPESARPDAAMRESLAPRPASFLQELDNGMARRLAGRVTVERPGSYVVRREGVRHSIAAADVIEMAVRNLRRCDFVGDARDLDLAYARIAHDVGLSQASGALTHGDAQRRKQKPRHYLSACEIALFTQMDRVVYEHVRSVFQPSR
jgi:hypothetical protein